MVTVKLSDKVCFLCGTDRKVVESKFKDGSLSAAVCWDHLWSLMTKEMKDVPCADFVQRRKPKEMSVEEGK